MDIREVPTPRPPDDFWPRFHEARRAMHRDEPDEPLASDERAERWMTFEDPHFANRRWEGVEDGRIVGFVEAGGHSPLSPTYESNRRLMWGRIQVHPDHRRRGIATQLLPLIIAEMERRGAEVVGAQLHVDAGFAFAEAVGGKIKSTERLSKCVIGGVDREMVKGWVEEGRRRNPDTQVLILDGPSPDDRIGELSDLLTELENLVPQEDAEHGDSATTPENMRIWEAQMLKSGDELSRAVSLEKDGRLTGWSGLAWSRDVPWKLDQLLTAVRKKDQGRGLGKWLKGEMFLTMTERHPEATEIRTGNASSNDPMLSINHRMGFQMYRVERFYQAPIDSLREYLARR